MGDYEKLLFFQNNRILYRICIIYDRWPWYWDTIWNSQMVLSISYQNVTLTKKGSDEGMMTVFPWGSNSSPISSFSTCSYQVASLDVKNIKAIFLLNHFFSE